MNILNYQGEIERYTLKLNMMQALMDITDDLIEKDQKFADELISIFKEHGALSYKQWAWVDILAQRGKGIKPLYGDFRPIQVAFTLAGESIKKPKIRLLSEQGKFIQLDFFPETKLIKVFIDGWQGHGYRKFAGTIEDGMIKPYSLDRLTEDVRMTIESLANDPVGVSKAMAKKLGCCIYCGIRLSDPQSKKRGYGPICAEHYGLQYTDEIDLNALFN